MGGPKETSQQINTSKESNAAESKLNDIPEAAQKVKKHLGDKEGENRIEGTKERKRRKRTAKKEETVLETGNQLTPGPLSHIPLKSLMDVEVKLVYLDEEDIAFEFAEPAVSTGTQGACHNSEEADAPNAPNSPQIDKWLQVTLKDASGCYRQKKYAVAAGQFRTALELCSKGAAMGKPFDSSPHDISSVASFIETKLATCYLKMRKPDLALNHSH
ncbi:PREDICTED: spermatogenesis-associated protein 16-like, partial [Tinamus guttatus]|uniref:spermatogenesis-associated protein 16-like n=1 Tax=Tinamus guttatus TaxID=94827 RepID=UPI00052E76BD